MLTYVKSGGATLYKDDGRNGWLGGRKSRGDEIVAELPRRALNGPIPLDEVSAFVQAVEAEVKARAAGKATAK
jgi:hypothetical protein